MKNGYIKIWRRIKDSSIFEHEGMLKLFILCLLKATHKAFDVTIDGSLRPVPLQPGQFITGRSSLWFSYHRLQKRKRSPKKPPKPTETTLWRRLYAMRDMKLIEMKSTNKFTVITICNWHKYQDRPGNKTKQTPVGSEFTEPDWKKIYSDD